MLSIELRVNGQLIGYAEAINQSQLTDVSNYQFSSISFPSPVTKRPRLNASGKINDHPRLQSAWALVAKVAEAVARHENEAEG